MSAHASLLPPTPNAPAPIRALGMLVDWAVVAIGATMVIMVFANVVMHAFSRDLAWVTEFAEFLMVWVTFLGGAAAARRGAHMTITEFVDKLGPRARQAADTAIALIVIAVLAALFWYGVGLVQAGWTNILTVLDWPMGLQYLALPVGSAITLVFAIYDLAGILRGRTFAERFGTT